MAFSFANPVDFRFVEERSKVVPADLEDVIARAVGVGSCSGEVITGEVSFDSRLII